MRDHEQNVDALKALAVEAVRSTLPAPIGLIAEMARVSLDAICDGTATRRFNDAVYAELVDGVFRRLYEVERKLRELQEAGGEASTVANLRLMVLFTQASRRAADSKKRRLLEDAFVHSFDRALYESALLEVLWDKLDRLSYGDLVLLRDVVDAGESRQHVHVRHRTANQGSMGRFHLDNLFREGLCFSIYPDRSGARPTELAEKLRLLLDEATPGEAAHEL